MLSLPFLGVAGNRYFLASSWGERERERRQREGEERREREEGERRERER